MPYLDSEKKFWDFRTEEVTDKILFDTKTTGTSYYNDFIYDADYMKTVKNLKGEIKYLTPREYFEGCAQIFGSTAQKQIDQTAADKVTYQHLLDVILKYKKKFPIGHLDYANKGQEGRHRMYVAGELSGWDTPQPVLIINWEDEEKHKQAEESARVRETEDKIDRAIRSALRYKFENIEDLRSQLQHELNNQFNVLSFEEDVPFELTTNDTQFIIKCKGIESCIDYENVKFTQSDDELLTDLEDSDDDISDWLKKILGESLEKHDTLNPKIWNGYELNPNIAETINQIVNKYVQDSEVLNPEHIIDIELLGSNANYNYTEFSDLDIHIIVNMEDISADPTLVQIACNAEKALFNKSYDIKIKGIDVELYVEDVHSGAMSNGIYSVLNNKWIKLPQQVHVPDMNDNEEFNSLLKEWTLKGKQLLVSNSALEIQRFINELYNLRRLSLMTDGEFSIGNLVFKEIRNLGLLSDLKDKMHELQSKELSLEKLN